MYSKHAQIRMRQRSIPPIVIDWLIGYGASEFDHHGAEIRFFDKRSRRQLTSEIGGQVVERLQPFLNTYLVMGTDGGVITVGHRTQRINRH
jgi:hypothetical protein